MHYKTIVLELLRERTELHEQLRLTRRLLPTLEACSQELRASHLSWMETLRAANPSSDPIQIESEAMELAIKELGDRLPSVSPALPQADEPLSLDAAMAFIANHTSRK
jgi:hypothetical protein